MCSDVLWRDVMCDVVCDAHVLLARYYVFYDIGLWNDHRMCMCTYAFVCMQYM